MNKDKRIAVVEIGESELGFYWWHLVGGNGQIIGSSETFTRRSDAKRAMRRAIQIIQSGLFRIEE